MPDCHVIISYERDPIREKIASEGDKILFLQQFPTVVSFLKKGTVFHASGIYQIGNGPTVLILPWILKHKSVSMDEKIIFDSLKEIKIFKDTLITLSQTGLVSALDLILRSHFLKINEEIDKLIALSFHNEENNKINVIKGKWLALEDLRNSPRPLKFTCRYNDLNKCHPILNFIKSFLLNINNNILSRPNLDISRVVLNKLNEVPFLKMNLQLALNAKRSALNNKKFSHWFDLIIFAENLLLSKKYYYPKAGISYQFQMDRFFEELIYKVGRLAYPRTTHTQFREELLGRSYWTSDSEIVMLDHIKNNMSSRPDIVIEADKELYILECKYKPFKIPYINSLQSDSSLKSFERNDRNQLLSFLIGLTPSPMVVGKHINIAVLFPCKTVNDFKCSSLVFSNAKFKIDNVSKNITQILGNVEQEHRLEVKFVGVSIERCLRAIDGKDKIFAYNLLGRISGRYTRREHRNKSRFQQAVDRRVSLASYIVKKGKNDNTLGRVKLAKIIYLMDSHLKLELMGEYKRHAAGPYNPRMFQDDKSGVEVIAKKESYFKTTHFKKRRQVKYNPSVNLEIGVEMAKNIFFDKTEEINKVYLLLRNLNTEQSEIVATLYACWNDLLKKGEILDDLDSAIIHDMKNNWHSCKKRFKDIRLLKALEWMKNNDLVPDGTGTYSQEIIKQEMAVVF